MKMHCKKCKGRVWVETDRPSSRFYDLVCINCGKRSLVDTRKGKFGAWLRESVLGPTNTTYFWVDRPHVNRRTLIARRGEEWRIVGERAQDFPDERPPVSD